MTVAVCLKWVDRRPELDASGAPLGADDRFAGISLADQAALELALASGESVTAITVGPVEAERALRDAAACGAARLIRIDAPITLDSAVTARLIADAIEDESVVWCGDYSLDRGSGSVPAFLAAELGWAQLCGLVSVTVTDGSIEATRRLDGGRRELLHSAGPAVCSVEGSVASLRRAGLAAALAAKSATISVATPATAPANPTPAIVRPFRPRARTFPPPPGQTARDRVRALVITDSATTAGERVTLDPPAAAARIVAALHDWRYLD